MITIIISDVLSAANDRGIRGGSDCMHRRRGKKRSGTPYATSMGKILNDVFMYLQIPLYGFGLCPIGVVYHEF